MEQSAKEPAHLPREFNCHHTQTEEGDNHHDQHGGNFALYALRTRLFFLQTAHCQEVYPLFIV